MDGRLNDEYIRGFGQIKMDGWSDGLIYGRRNGRMRRFVSAQTVARTRLSKSPRDELAAAAVARPHRRKNCAVIRFQTSSLVGVRARASSQQPLLLLAHQRNYPGTQISSAPPTPKTEPAVCLCADLSATVAPPLHIVRSSRSAIHHLPH